MILFNKLQGREYVHTLKAKEKMMRKKYILIISIALLLVAGCSHKTNNPENKSENVNVSNQKENESTEINNIVDVKLKSVKYTGSYDNRFLGTSDDKVYLFDANGQILNEYSNDNYPTEFFIQYMQNDILIVQNKMHTIKLQILMEMIYLINT